MDEKEQADRLAAAEALFMISNRGEKPHIPVKSRPTRRGKKQKVVDYDDITASKKRIEGPTSPRSRSRSRSKSSDGANQTNDRGRGRRGGFNKRGRGRGRGKKLKNIGRNYDSKYEYSESDDDNVSRLTIDTRISPKNKGSKINESSVPKAQRGKGKKRGGKSKVKSRSRTSKSQSEDFDESDEVPSSSTQISMVGLSGASLSKSDPILGKSSRNATSATDQGISGGNLPSLGLVSGFNKVSLASWPHGGAESVALPSLNLGSLTEGNLPSVNLPSLPSEYPFLQLSSQPTPNLSSLGEVTVSQAMEVDPQVDRGKSEKFLPLKKRKLHKADESADTPTTATTDSPVDGLSVSDSEERYEAISPEPARPPFTVQAPPIITMQTLMEIKTALQADDDGDLPLHIAVVHENMRMVAKLISLMRIAGKHVDKFNKQQQTPLHLAIKLDFTEAVELLLKSGADVNAVDCSGSSAIHMAVQGRSTPILRLLLEKCPNVQLNNRNIEGLTPLHTAVDNGDLEQAELLLSHGAHIDVTDGKSGRTPLFRAAESNHKPMVELLLKRGANVDVPSYAGVTVSMAAQGRNLHGVLKLLGSVQDKLGVGLEGGSMAGLSGKSLTSNPPPPLLYVGYTPTSKSPPFSPGIVTTSDAAQESSAPNYLSVSVNSSAPSPQPSHFQPIEGEKSASERLSYLLHQHRKLGTTDGTSGGVMLEREDAGSVTKVFHNVFMLTDEKKGRVHMESVSEPSSPDARMGDDTETKSGRKDNLKGRGLMSLPETIDISGEDNHPATKEFSASHKISTLANKISKPAAAMVIRRVPVSSPKSHINVTSDLEAVQHVPGLYKGRVSNDRVIHLVPSSTVPVVLTSATVPSSSSGPRSGSSRLTSTLALSRQTQEQVMSSSSPILVPVLQSSSSPSPSSPLLLPSSSSSSTPISSKSVSTTSKDPGAPPLSSIQAKLYETLLRRSQSHPGSTVSNAGPREAERTSPPPMSPSVMSKMLLAPVKPHPLSPSLSPAGVVSYRVIPGSSSLGALLEPLPMRRDPSAVVPPLRVPSLAHIKKSAVNSPASSPPGTPLNLSKPSPSRSKEGAELSMSGSTAAISLSEMTETQGAVTKGEKLSVEKPGKKLISIGMRRHSNAEKSSPPLSPSPSSRDLSQSEMVVRPSEENSMLKKRVSVAEKPITIKTGSSIVLDPAMVETMAKGEINLSHFPHVSKCVRELLSKQSLLPKSSALAALSTSLISTNPAGFLAKSLVSAQNSGARVITHQTSLAQNNIVGLSGAIISSISVSQVPSKLQETEKSISKGPSKLQETGKSVSKGPSKLQETGKSVSKGPSKIQELSNSLSEDKPSQPARQEKKSRRSASQKHGGVKKPRKTKGANKSLPEDKPDSPATSTIHPVPVNKEQIPNLSKINSKTDKKLKQFLVAKRVEGLSTTKTKEWQGLDIEEEEEEECSQESLDESNSLRTVGIFSGHVQRLKLGKSKVPTPASPDAHLPNAIPIPVCVILTSMSSSASPSLPSSLSSSAKAQVVMSPSSTALVSSSLTKTPTSKTTTTTDSISRSDQSLTLTANDTPAVKKPLPSTASIVNIPATDSKTNTEPIRIEVSDLSEEDEPMEIDVSPESAPESPTEEKSDVRLSSDSTKLPDANLSRPVMPKVQIVIQSPTPPLPVETNESVTESDAPKKEVT